MRVNGILCLAAAMMATLAPAAGAARTDTNTKIETRVVKKPIPFAVEYEFSRTVGAGRLSTAREGKSGQLIETYEVTIKNGKPVSKKLISKEREEPVSKLVLMGQAGYKTSRSRFIRSKVLTMHASAYDASPQTLPGSSGRTASGHKAVYGVVAVDPRVIPLGTLLYIEGYGFALASDTGGAIKGNRIDLCMNSRSQALKFGRRSVKVHVLGKPK